MLLFTSVLIYKDFYSTQFTTTLKSVSHPPLHYRRLLSNGRFRITERVFQFATVLGNRSSRRDGGTLASSLIPQTLTATQGTKSFRQIKVLDEQT